MASGNGGIDLLSVYNDEEEEEEEEEEEGEGEDEKHVAVEEDAGGVARATSPDASFEATLPPLGLARSSPLENGIDDESPASPVARSPTPPPLPPSMLQYSPFPAISHSPPPPPHPSSSSVPEPLNPQRMGMGSLVIVDYAHDETAMSPEPEEGEILSNGRFMVGTEVRVPDGNADDRTPPGTSHTITPSTQLESFQPSDISEQPRSETITPMDVTGSVTEVAQVEAAVVSIEVQLDDPLSRFLPPPPSAECPKELQEKINKFLAYKRAGKSFNADLHNRKDYRNPDFLQHAVRYQDIDQIGTCFSKDVFDPHGYDKSDYIDEIENDLRREMERRRDQERKRNQKMDSVAGGMPPTMIVTRSNMSAQNSVATLSVSATTVLQLAPTSVESKTKDSRQNKKSKWDKIDGDVKSSTLSGGHDNPSTTSVHAALLSAANAGAGYTAFAQQKRREAEEKKSGDRKFDKRS